MSDDRIFNQPILAPLLFTIYVTVVLFTAFTILIASELQFIIKELTLWGAVISDAYVSVLEESDLAHANGVIASFGKWVQAKCRDSPTEPAPSEEPEEKDVAKLVKQLTALVQDQQQSIKALETQVGRLVPRKDDESFPSYA